MEKHCRNFFFIGTGLLALGLGLTALGIALIVVPPAVPSALPGIKKGLKKANQWRKDNNLKTHKEFKKEMKQAKEEGQ